jgi:cysteine desulfurase
VSFVGRVGADVLTALDGVAASTGSACHAGSVELSPVLAAMGVDPHVGMGAVRLSLGRMTTEDEIRAVLARAGELPAAGV